MHVTLFILVAVIILITGFLSAWIVQSGKIYRQKEVFEINLRELRNEKNSLENQYIVSNERLNIKTDELLKVGEQLVQINALAENRGMEIAALQTVNSNLKQQLESQKKELMEIQSRLTAEFRILPQKF